RRIEFHEVPAPTDEEVARFLAMVCRRIGRLLSRRGLTSEAGESAPPDPLSEESPPLTGISAASVLGRIALGPRAGAPVRRLGQGAVGIGPRLSFQSSSSASSALLARRPSRLDVLSARHLQRLDPVAEELADVVFAPPHDRGSAGQTWLVSMS